MSALSRDEFHDFLEKIQQDVGDLWRLASLLSTRVYGDLDVRRAHNIDEDAITLQFQRDGIDISKWLAGDVSARAVAMRDRIDMKLKEFDEARIADDMEKGGAQ